jgi:SAM-dependent methyltransferase
MARALVSSQAVRALAARAHQLRDAIRGPDATSGADQWQRTVLNRAVDRHLRSLDPPQRDAVEISGDAQAGHPWRSFTSLNFPEFDLCAPLTVTRRFDVVICEQVIEHVADPWAAARNLRGLSSPGGRVIVSTPFLIRIHELPMFEMRDYWRFAPRGLRQLLEGAGLIVDIVESWGNRRCITANFDRWPAQRRRQSLRNEPDLPVQVWAFAHAPG